MVSIKKQSILITLDAVRADHLSCYGYRRNTTPGVDFFSRNAHMYHQCLSPGSFTPSVMTSLFNGTYPIYQPLRFGIKPEDVPHAVAAWQFPALKRLRDAGITTAGITSNILMSSKYLMGFNKVFEHFDETCINHYLLANANIYFTSKDVINRAIAWIGQHKEENFFLWIHLMDAHGPYVPTSNPIYPYVDKTNVTIQRIIYDWETEYAIDLARGLSGPGIRLYQLQNIVRDANRMIVDYERRIQYYVAKYDTGIHMMDSALQVLFKSLQKFGIYDSSQIIIHADHGESLGENGIYFSHGNTSTYEMIHVPLLVKTPSNTGKIIHHPVSASGIMHTVFNYYSLNTSGLNFNSALEDLSDKDEIYSFSPKHMALCIHNKLYTVQNGSLSIIGQPRERLFEFSETARPAITAIPKNKLFTKKYILSSPVKEIRGQIPLGIYRKMEQISGKKFI